MKFLILLSLIGIAVCVSPPGRPDNENRGNRHHNGPPGHQGPPGPPGHMFGGVNCFEGEEVCEKDSSDGFGYFNGCNNCVCMGSGSACTRMSCNGEYSERHCEKLRRKVERSLNSYISKQNSGAEEENEEEEM